MQKISPNVLTPVVSRVEWEWSGVDWGCSGLSAFDSASASVQKSLGRQKIAGTNEHMGFRGMCQYSIASA